MTVNTTQNSNGDKIPVVNGATGEAASAKKKKFWHINKETLAFKFHFFLFIGAFSAVFPYITVFAQLRLGINASSLALALTVQQFTFIITKLLISYVVDYLNKLKQVIIFLTIIQGICLFLLLPLPPISLKNGNQIESDEAITCKSVTCEIIKKNLSTLDLAKENENFSHNLTCANTCLSFCNFSDNLNISSTSCMCYICSNYLNNRNSTQTDISFNDESDVSRENSNGTIKLYLNEMSNSSCYCVTQNGILIADEYILECFNASTVFDETSVQLNSVSSTCCKNGKNFLISFGCVLVKNETTKTSPYDTNKNVLHTYQFWIFVLILMISGACVNALFTLSDTACYESIQKTGADFGQLRLWGAFGWGLIAPFAGFLNDYTGDYIAAWCVMAVMCAIDLCIISKVDLVKPELSQNILKDVGTVFKSKEFLIFELGVLMNGIGTGIVWFYLIWFLTTIGGTRLLAGLTQTLQCFVGEIPFMFFSGWIIKRIGYMNVLTLALMGYTLRFFWYSYLYNPWLVLPIECMHGFTYGIFYAGVTAFGKLSAKPGTEATTQAVVCSTHEGLGAGLGCIIAGVGFDYLGSHRTFFFAGIFAGCGMLINIAFTIFLGRRKKTIDVTFEAEA